MLIRALMDSGEIVVLEVSGKAVGIHRIIRRICLGWVDVEYVPYDKLIVMFNSEHKKLRYNRAASTLLNMATGGNAVVMSYADWLTIKKEAGIE